MEPKVGVVTINWNGYERTLRCVSSLESQDYASYHVYIVDNASDHDEGHRLANLYRHHPKITVILNPHNDGYAGGNNVGIERARLDGYAQGIWCLNNDATAEPGALSCLVGAARGDNTVGLIGSTILYPDRKTIYALGGATFNTWSGIDRLVGAHTTWPSKLRQTRTLGYVSGAAVYITTSGLAAGHGFDPDYFLYCEELDLAVRTRRAGLRLVYVPQSIVIHASAASAVHLSSTYVYYFLRNRLLVLRKRLAWYHWPTYLIVYMVYYVLGFAMVLGVHRKIFLWPYISKAITDFFGHRWGRQSLWQTR